MNYTYWQERTLLLLGEEKCAHLKNASVLVCGVGGVGAYAAEQLVRSGIGRITLVDNDTVHASNRNRQLPALFSTEGCLKTEVLKNRFADINPDLQIKTINEFITPENIDLLQLNQYHYVLDAIDSLSPKVALIKTCIDSHIPVISSFGAGGKTDPRLVEIADVSKSHHCKFGFMVRKRLHKFNIYQGFKVVFSPEEVAPMSVKEIHQTFKRTTVGTIAYMPAIFGCLMASEVILDVIQAPGK